METCQTCGERLTGSARFCAACGAPADSEQTRFASDVTRLASEETRVAQPRPVEPLPVRTPPPSTVRMPQPVVARRNGESEGDEQVVFTVRPTLLFIKAGYVLAALGGIALIALLAWQPWVPVSFFVSLLLALAPCAAYVSLVNDVTDRADDHRAGKTNRMAGRPAWQAALILAAPLGVAAVFTILWLDDLPLVVAYWCAWGAFTLYSVPPFRLKRRGILGVVADASGAHLFPTLVAALLASGRTVYAINPYAVSRYRDRHRASRAKSDARDAIVLANIVAFAFR